MQWGGFLLDKLVAPEFSTLTCFSLPDVPELPNYYGSFFLNNVFHSEFETRARTLVFSMLRHLTQGIREYRSGRIALEEFGHTKPQSSEAVTLYLRALTNFEQVIIHTDIALGSGHGVARCFEVSTSSKRFKQGENSPEERLRILYNAVKHFDNAVVEGNSLNTVAPVWLIEDWIRGIHKEKKGKPLTVKTITIQFKEIAAILADLTSDAAFLSEDVYRRMLVQPKAEFVQTK